MTRIYPEEYKAEIEHPNIKAGLLEGAYEVPCNTRSNWEDFTIHLSRTQLPAVVTWQCGIYQNQRGTKIRYDRMYIPLWCGRTVRKGTNEKQAGKLKIGLSMCKAFGPSLFGISYKIHLPPGKKEIRRQIQEHIQKKGPKNNNNTIFQNGKP